MSLEIQVMESLKEAMKSKDEAALRSLRAIKAEIIKAKTDPGANGVVSEEGEIKLLQKLVKSRKDSLEIFEKQQRADLAEKEKEEIAIIEKFLPKQMTEEEIRAAVETIIANLGTVSPADMGKIIGLANKELAGKAEGKTISMIVKDLLK